MLLQADPSRSRLSTSHSLVTVNLDPAEVLLNAAFTQTSAFNPLNPLLETSSPILQWLSFLSFLYHSYVTRHLFFPAARLTPAV
jgi:hypothetical protein